MGVSNKSHQKTEVGRQTFELLKMNFFPVPSGKKTKSPKNSKKSKSKSNATKNRKKRANKTIAQCVVLALQTACIKKACDSVKSRNALTNPTFQSQSLSSRKPS